MILTQASRARNALWLMFFVMGVVSMAWVPRIPEIKTANALTDTQFGLVLVASSAFSFWRRNKTRTPSIL